MDKEQEEQGFRVTDKRGFKEDGETRGTENTETSGERPAGEQGSSTEPPPADRGIPHPPIDFSSYILSFYYQGLMLLGALPNQDSDKSHEDVDAARHIIDLLSMLEEKTKGNLTIEEKKLLEDVLYELRMAYMAKTDRIKL
jgi:hypothetical protein